MDDFMEFIFGKYLKFILLLLGFLTCAAYGNHPGHYGYSVIAAALIFSAVYLSVHERNNKR